MKKILFVCLALSAVLSVRAEEKMLFDFENYALGDSVPMWNFYGGATTSKAVVTADPVNAANKVLHVTNETWNTHVAFPLDGMTADEVTGGYQYLVFDLYRPEGDGEYKQFSVRIGNDTVYADGGFVSQGAAGLWHTKRYNMARVSGDGDKLYMGYNSNDAEFYIDNVRLLSVDYGYDVSDETQTLRYYADKCGLQIGAAVPVWRIDVDNDNLDITRTIYSNFNTVVAENEMKIDALQPNRGEFAFGNADRLVAFAERHGMAVRGHTLVWHSQVPGWISSDGKKNDKNYTRAELLDIMKTHITTVLTHFKGKVMEWDVLNECLDDDQSIVRSNPAAYNLRSSVWLKAIGEDYIDSAFVYARRVDPDIKLYINDYGVEFQGNAKTQAYYNLVRRLQKSGIPLDGVGLQCHLTVGDFDSTKFDNNVKRYAALGLDCIVTELDIANNWNFADSQERQAAEYAAIARVLMNYSHCPTLMVWGVTDDMSWRENAPLLFDATVQAKPAFFALREEYAAHAAESSAIEQVSVSPATLSPYVDVYDVLGRLVAGRLHRSQLSTLPAGCYLIDKQMVMIYR